MSSVDPRVVDMKFDNKQFEDNVKTTITSLDALNKGLKLEGATKGLTDVGNAAKSLSLGHVEQSLSNIADRFRVMSIVAITALANITTQALQTGVALVKSLTIDPIKSGLSEYETNLNSIQTILSNTQWQNTGLNDVNKALQTLNEYSDQTIYSFSEMARNIGTFTAAGVKLEVATDAIKGIANLAAISGSNSQQAATAMYQLSQALAAGKVALIDWNSVVNAGMGGKVFQDALLETARVHGVAVDKMVKDAGGFRNTLENGWLTGAVLTETLAKFTGDLSEAQLKTMGYNKAQIAGIIKMGKTAQDAATKVKTMSQLIGTLQEAAGSGWAQTWQIIFGDFEEARDMFTNVNNVLGEYVKSTADMRNKVLGDWKELGGRKVIIEAISNAFNALISVARPIRDAFREMFPAITGMQLYEISLALREFTAGLKIGGETADKLRRTFAGVFAILGIGWDILKEVAKTFFHLVGLVTDGTGSFLGITAKIGDFLVSLRASIKEGNLLSKIFGNIGKVLEIPIKILLALIKAVAGVFGEAGHEVITTLDGIGERVETRLSPLASMGKKISDIWEKVSGIFNKTGQSSDGMSKKISDLMNNIGETLKKIASNIKFDSILDSINTGLFTALTLIIRRFLKNGLSITGILNLGGSGGVLDTIKRSFDELTNTMKAMQAQLKANALLKIAAAIAILTAAVIALSLIDSNKLTSALVGLTAMFTQLSAAAVILDKFASSAGLLKLPFITAALILLAIAVDLLAISVLKMAKLDWNSLARGLTGLVVVLGALVGTVHLLPDDKKLISTSLGLIVLATAIGLLATSVQSLGGMNWEDLSKGLIGVGAILGALILFTKFAEADKGGIAQGAGIVLLAFGVKLLADSIVKIANLSWNQIAKGLLGLAGAIAVVVGSLELLPPTAVLGGAGMLVVGLSLSQASDSLKKIGDLSWSQILKGLTGMLGVLALMTAALILVPPTAPLGAAALLIVSMALANIADNLKKMGDMSWEQIAKGLVALAGALLIISVALAAMSGTIGGAAALVITAAALSILLPILIGLGNMSWDVIGKGLLTLAAVFLVIGVAGALLTPVIPTLIGLGAAIILLGVGMLAAGVGILAFSVGLTALALIGEKGVDALVSMIGKLAGVIPMVMTKIGEGLISVIKVIASSGTAITEAITTILISLLTAIINISPKLEEALIVLIKLIIDVLVDAIPKIAEAAYKILIGILIPIRDNIRKVSDLALEIIAEFIKGLGDGLPKVLQAGADFIISFINGLATKIRENSEELGKAGGNLATAIIEGMAKGISAGASVITNAAKNVAKDALKAAMKAIGAASPAKKAIPIGQFFDEGVALGLDRYSKVVNASAVDVGEGAMTTLRKTLSGLGEGLNSGIDLNPTVRPVLDLTSIRKSADEIGSMFRQTPIVLDATISRATDAAGGFQTNQDIADELSGDGGDKFVFNQYNSSPKALSDADIYRQSKNLLSKAKEAVSP